MKASGKLQVGAGGAPSGEAIQLPPRKPADHRSVADRLDFLVASLGLREKHQAAAEAETRRRRQDARQRMSAADAAKLPEVEPQPAYTIERPSPGVVRIRLHFPDGTTVGADGRSANAAFARLLERAGAMLEGGFLQDGGGTAAAKQGVAQLRRGTGTDSWGRAVGPMSMEPEKTEPMEGGDE